MNIKDLLLNIGKLIFTGLTFFAGMVLGGALAAGLGLPQPAMPEGMNISNAMVYMLLTSPLLGLALALIARGLPGSFAVRATILSFLMWVAYCLNTQIEASIFSTMASGMAFSLVDFAVPSVFLGLAVAWLFPADARMENPGFLKKPGFWSAHTPLGWGWRLVLAAVAFMPIYWLFGNLVVPFTGDYYRQSMYGLSMPTLDQILPVLFIRSVLFLIACLPVIALWNKSARTLFLSLGFALYVLVGLQLLAADWMPLAVRVPHTLEILADEFTYAGVLVLLLVPGAARAAVKAGQKMLGRREPPTAVQRG